MLRGIILAGGRGTRLLPVTKNINKHLLPIYDKPMIFYPLSVLMLAGIREVLIITTGDARPQFAGLLGDGSDIGMEISYATQDRPNGLAEAFLIGREFLNGGACALILGDNLFFGHGLTEQLKAAVSLKKGACVFAYPVSDPERYGVLQLDTKGRPVDILEKPEKPPSNWAVTGLYVFDGRVSEVAAGVEPSARGELEITCVISDYLKRSELTVEWLGRGHAWLDMGTHESFLKASQFIETLEQRQSLKVACLEEIALSQGFIGIEAFRKLTESYPSSTYGEYLQNVLKMEEAKHD